MLDELLYQFSTLPDLSSTVPVPVPVRFNVILKIPFLTDHRQFGGAVDGTREWVTNERHRSATLNS